MWRGGWTQCLSFPFLKMLLKKHLSVGFLTEGIPSLCPVHGPEQQWKRWRNVKKNHQNKTRESLIFIFYILFFIFFFCRDKNQFFSLLVFLAVAVPGQLVLISESPSHVKKFGRWCVVRWVISSGARWSFCWTSAPASLVAFWVTDTSPLSPRGGDKGPSPPLQCPHDEFWCLDDVRSHLVALHFDLLLPNKSVFSIR